MLLLDEPLAGLGDADRERIASVIRQLSRSHTVLLIEHDIDRVLALSDRITVLHQGKVIAEGEPAAIANDPNVLEAYLGRPDARRIQPVSTGAAPVQRQPLLMLSGVDAGYRASRILHDSIWKYAKAKSSRCLDETAWENHDPSHHHGDPETDQGNYHVRRPNITSLSPDRINRQGIAIVPEGRRIFPNLTVTENLCAGSTRGRLAGR